MHISGLTMLSRRTHYMRLLAMCMVTGLIVFVREFSVWSSMTPDVIHETLGLTSSSSSGSLRKWLDAAGNTTLGFGSIQSLSVPFEFDRQAALALQAEVSGLDIEPNAAVAISDMHPKGKGSPPSSRVAIEGQHKELKPGAKACLFSHMKMWQKLLASKHQTMFIIESDAMWGRNIREQNKIIARGLYQLQEKLGNITSLPRPTANDPFNSSNWDIMNYGSCIDREPNRDNYVIMHDPDAIDSHYFDLETEMHEQRIVRQTGSMVCTTAYAISRKGAMKMLLRAALNFDAQVDVLTEILIKQGKLKGFGAFPVPFVQWKYKRGLGADWLGSNLGDRNPDEVPENTKELWADVMKTESVWTSENGFPPIKDSALDTIKEYIKEMV